MSNSESVNLSLLENSHSFVNEAVSKALSAQDDVRQWQFAILALVQSAELSLKAALKAIHPVLVYENIDSPVRMVTLHTALARLEHPFIGAIVFSERDKQRIDRASKIRNQVTHSDFELKAEYAAANFFELFGFVSDFQRRHLSTDLSKIIPLSSFESLRKIKKALEELVRRAKARIDEEKIDKDFILACPNCGEDTFIIQDSIDLCYVCSYAEKIVECPQCSRFFFEFEMESFVEDLDVGLEEGRGVIYNSYGYSQYDACPECLSSIRQDIQDQRESDEFHRLEEEYYLSSSC